MFRWRPWYPRFDSAIPPSGPVFNLTWYPDDLGSALKTWKRISAIQLSGYQPFCCFLIPGRKPAEISKKYRSAYRRRVFIWISCTLTQQWLRQIWSHYDTVHIPTAPLCKTSSSVWAMMHLTSMGIQNLCVKFTDRQTEQNHGAHTDWQNSNWAAGINQPQPGSHKRNVSKVRWRKKTHFSTPWLRILT